MPLPLAGAALFGLSRLALGGFRLAQSAYRATKTGVQVANKFVDNKALQAGRALVGESKTITKIQGGAQRFPNGRMYKYMQTADKNVGVPTKVAERQASMANAKATRYAKNIKSGVLVEAPTYATAASYAYDKMSGGKTPAPQPAADAGQNPVSEADFKKWEAEDQKSSFLKTEREYTNSDAAKAVKTNSPRATIKKAEKAVKIKAKAVADDADEVPGGAVAIKDMGSKPSVQLKGNMDASAGKSEEELKKIGLDASNAEMAASGDTGSFLGRLSEGNIDDPNSVAYKKYGAGYGREVLKRRAASK